MKIRLLNKGYKRNKDFYIDFLEGNLFEEGKDYISDEEVILNEMPDFPIYMGLGSREQRKDDFIQCIQAIEKNFISLSREYILDELFWHSYLCLYKRDYLLKMYPEIKDSYSKFTNIVVKNFDWENYIYKCVLAAQYVNSYAEKDQSVKYYQLIVENLDLFNYIIKYEIFRNGQFLINLLDIIDETGKSKILKAKIKNRQDLGKDERYGRRVIYEFNKSYPVILGPMLEKNELSYYFSKFLALYYQGKEELVEEDEWLECEPGEAS